jgi:hypothetical protein
MSEEGEVLKKKGSYDQIRARTSANTALSVSTTIS